jgi:hypothetical protein
MARPVERDPKKPYARPILTVYGTVRELTQKVALQRALDNGRFPRVRTSLH